MTCGMIPTRAPASRVERAADHCTQDASAPAAPTESGTDADGAVTITATVDTLDLADTVDMGLMPTVNEMEYTIRLRLPTRTDISRLLL